MLEHISQPLNLSLKKKKLLLALRLNLIIKKVFGAECALFSFKRGVLKIKVPQEKAANFILKQDAFLNEINSQLQEKEIKKIVFI